MTIFATIAIGATKWAVQLQRSTITTEDKMTAMSLAYNKWLEYIAQDYDKVSSEGKTTSVNKKFDIQSDVSSEKTLPSGGTSKPVVITVFKAGTDSVAYALTAEKVNPSLDEFYTKAEVDGKLKALESSMDSKLNNLQNWKIQRQTHSSWLVSVF